MRAFGRILAVVGLGMVIAAAVRLRGRGGLPPQRGRWQLTDQS